MRLLNVDTRQLEEFQDGLSPAYAILSHTWREEEVTFQDLTIPVSGPGASAKAGYVKLMRCCELAKRDELQYAWIDTCCIDKTSSAELSEAINSMHRWYQYANCCYVFLDDYPATASEGDRDDDPARSLCNHPSVAQDVIYCSQCFRQCRWFTRGWTLQELLAPTFLKFYNRYWIYLGYVEDRESHDHGRSQQEKHLGQHISDATCIPLKYINHTERCSSASVAQRFSWASNRRTSRTEDMAYCLFGLFDVHMPLLYGEGSKKAFVRLQEEIMKVCDDHSIFAWGLKRFPRGRLTWNHSSYIPNLTFKLRDQGLDHGLHAGPLLAPSPMYFENSWNIIPTRGPMTNKVGPHAMTNRGLRVDIHFVENQIMELNNVSPEIVERNFITLRRSESVSYVALACVEEDNPYCPLVMCVIRLEGNLYARALGKYGIAAVVPSPRYTDDSLRSIYLLQQPQSYTNSVPTNGRTGITYFLTMLPRDFAPCQDAYPPGCWDHQRGVVSISHDNPDYVVLIFPVAKRTPPRVTLILGGNPSTWYCHLKADFSHVSAQRVSSINKGYTLPVLGNSAPIEVGIGQTDYRICMTEDSILGGVPRLQIKEVSYPSVPHMVNKKGYRLNS